MQNKNMMIGIGIAVVILLGIAGYFLFANKTKAPTASPMPTIEDSVVEDIDPDEIGLEVMVRADGKAIKFTVEKREGIESIDYTISYTKELNGEEIPEGLIGQVDMDKSPVGIDYREFGTCSSGTCRYDKVISPVILTLKVVKEDGKVYSTEKTVEID